MNKHVYQFAITDEGVVVGEMCSRCFHMAMYENGSMTDDDREQECDDGQRWRSPEQAPSVSKL